ncbi:tRNA(Met) cytidine acetyltransferase TmcA [Cobetia sp. QF-1]|uniref:tRNA(Met) cytidine acetyltransferase TmcA n=1 Tax=Cobetia sp. QF-1 TaxID=1969833 RepID=UPI001595E5F2|nr:GNAT family N-acetyltransferase [Cobetia sp. QF-1]
MTTSLETALDLPALQRGSQRLQTRLLACRHRGCLWISGPRTLVQARALALCAAWPDAAGAPLWLGGSVAVDGASVRHLAMAKAATQLGGEQSLVIFDAASGDSGFDPDAFGAVSGTLKAGGLLVLLTPAEWAQADPVAVPDADYARLAHWPVAREQLAARYLTRLARCLQRDQQIMQWPETVTLPLAFTATAVDSPSPSDAGPVVSSGDSSHDPDCLTDDQCAVVAALAALAPHRPLVISADRGRGKSAALGIAAARCLRGGEDVWLTAPRPAAVVAIFARLAALVPDGCREGNVFRMPAQGEQTAAVLRFIAPDALGDALEGLPAETSAALPRLYVDEAAAIPTPLLKDYLAHFPRIAFATTVHGYEGTGRGFQLRFRAHLDRQCPGWQAREMTAPVRWAAHDPLEQLTSDVLLLTAEPCEVEVLAATGNAADQFRAWLAETQVVVLDRERLAQDEAALTQLFGLLVQAHYRTTPSDLRQLLDTPGLTLMGIRHCTSVAKDVTACESLDEAGEESQGERWLGVVAVVEEGGFPAPLAAEIWSGQRRPRGHLLAQSLAAHAGHQAAAEARWWRVLRIAVHPALWRCGQGTRLLQAVEQHALLQGIARLGTSFGAEVGLLAFWQAQGFAPLRLGLKRDAASGEHAVMMGKALAPDTMPLLEAMQADFQYLLPSLLAHELSILPDILRQSLSQHYGALLGDEASLGYDEQQTRHRLDWYRRGGGGLALLRPWLVAALSDTASASRLSDEVREGLTLALDGQDAPTFMRWAATHGLDGRKARDRWCRAAVGQLVQ